MGPPRWISALTGVTGELAPGLCFLPCEDTVRNGAVSPEEGAQQNPATGQPDLGLQPPEL